MLSATMRIGLNRPIRQVFLCRVCVQEKGQKLSGDTFPYRNLLFVGVFRQAPFMLGNAAPTPLRQSASADQFVSFAHRLRSWKHPVSDKLRAAASSECNPGDFRLEFISHIFAGSLRVM